MNTISIDRSIKPLTRPLKNLDLINPDILSLDNGAELVFIPGGNEEIVKVDVIIELGICHQDKSLLAMATAKMIPEGSGHMDSTEISEKLDYYGSFFDIEVKPDSVKVSIVFLRKFAAEMIPLLFDLVFDVKFREKEFNAYQSKVEQRFLMKIEQTDFQAARQLYHIIFGEKHPLGRLINANDIHQININDLERFHQNYFTNPMHIVVSGKISSEIEKLVIHYANNIPRNQNTISNSAEFQMTSNVKKKLIQLDEASQNAIMIGLPWQNRNHEDYPLMKILSILLGGYFGSRLMQNIREEKGLTYGIEANLDAFSKLSLLTISSEVKAENWKEALHEIEKEITILSKYKIPKKELELVQAYISGAMTRMFNGPFRQATEWGSLRTAGLDFDYYNKFVRVLKGLDSESLLNTAQNYLQLDKLYTVVVGNTN